KLLDLDIPIAKQQHTLCWQTIAASPAGLLVVRLHRTRQIKVHDAAHVWLVHTHTKRIGGHDQAALALHKRVLGALPFSITQPGVVDERLRTALVQETGDLLHGPAGWSINDAAAPLPGRQ